MKTSIIISSAIEFHLSKSVYIIALTVLGILLLIFLVRKYVYNRKIKKIIKSYDGKEQETKQTDRKKKDTAKSRSITDSPYRERKSGVTWGGGNIKGANATRGTRKTFLKK